MAIISFPNQVLDPTSVNPNYIPTTNYSLSSKGVDIITIGSNFIPSASHLENLSLVKRS